MTPDSPDPPKRPFGSWLLGRASERGPTVRRRVRVLLNVALAVANVVGAGVVVVLTLWVIPRRGPIELVTVVAIPIYLVGALVVGLTWGNRRLWANLRWVAEERPPTDKEQRIALRAPLHLLGVQAALWGAAAVLFTVLDGLGEPALIPRTLLTVGLGGAVTCANTYLLSEFLLRPVAARAIAARETEHRVQLLGTSARAVLAWALGSAVPVAGLMIVAVFALAQRDVSVQKLAVAVLGIGGTTILVGLVLTLLAVRATVDPVHAIRAGMERVESGSLDVEIAVYDGTELGQLQAGFNRMLAGLREREHVRDLFGRHVGEDVARSALDRGIELGGEVRDVAAVFVDVIGSTTLASNRPPTEVVSLLNRFFTVVVDVVMDHGGLINKFEGDGALAVFGAPSDHPDPRAAALATARTIAARIADEVPECRAGIGVSAGSAVAGNVGGERRFEYTVIGDPVNEAARLCDLAKTMPEGVVASAATVEGADPDEGSRWQIGDEIVLRGRPTPTRLATPARHARP